MLEIKPASTTDFNKILPILKELDPRLPDNEWYEIFKLHWENQLPCIGYTIVDNNIVHGFISTIYTERKIGGRIHRFCNLGSWIVRPEYRTHTLSLLSKVLVDKSTTFTAFSANERAHSVLKRLNFQEYQKISILKIPSLLNKLRNNTLFINIDKSILDLELTSTELKIFNDHKNFSGIHINIKDSNNNHCYTIFKNKRMFKLPFLELQYISNKTFFDMNLNPISSSICSKLKTFGLLIPINNTISAGSPLMLKNKLPKLFRSFELKPDDIDTLYSEKFILNL